MKNRTYSQKVYTKRRFPPRSKDPGLPSAVSVNSFRKDLELLFGNTKYHTLPDFWAWLLWPEREDKGWGPHVDRGGYALDDNGNPISLTLWLPLLDATPENGCMYIIPQNKNPGKIEEADRLHEIPHDSVRAIPARAGEYLIWNQAVMHWGGQASKYTVDPRVSLAFEFQRESEDYFSKPLIDFDDFGFEKRLELIGAQFLKYKHMYGGSPVFDRFYNFFLENQCKTG